MGLVTLNEHAVIVQANDAATQMLGGARGSLSGRFFYKVVAPQDRSRFWNMLGQWAADIHSVAGEDLRLSGDRPIDVQLHVHSAKDEALGELRWRLALVDITQRKKLEQELRAVEKALEQRISELRMMAIELIETEERERRRFADLLHEDLQQMIASARFQLQAVGSDKPADPELENVSRILEESIAKSRRGFDNLKLTPKRAKR